MKKLLFITLFSMFFVSKGQRQKQWQLPHGVVNAKIMVDSTFNWKIFDPTISTSIKTDFLIKLFNTEKEFGRNESSEVTEEEFVDHYLRHVHLLDLDKDGDLDLIFDGLITLGREIGNVIIYTNQDGELTRVFSAVGTIIFLDPNNKRMVIHQYPCCANQMNYLNHYDLNFSSDTLFNIVKVDLFVGRYLYWQKNVQILPQSMFSKEKKCTLTADTIELRYSPTFDNSQDMCIHGDANIIYRYSKNTIGDVLAESTDGNWLFVRMQYNVESTNRCFTENVQSISDIAHLYGWIHKNKIE